MKNRLPSGGLIDRSHFIDFTYDGKKLKGFAGDSLASALLANNIWLTNRSFKYHRPRGIFTNGPEEPNALVQLEKGAYTTPNTPATTQELYDDLYAKSQNCFPSARHDFAGIISKFSRLLPAGFYYKTFMWPASAWKIYEHFIRKMAGLGVASAVADPDIYESEYAHPDLLIVGGGIAGIVAALAAINSKAKIILVEQSHSLGCNMFGHDVQINGEPINIWLRNALEQLQQAPNITILPRTVLFGYYNHNYLTASEKINHHLSPAFNQHHGNLRERLWHFRAKHVLLATGAIERPPVYANNDVPGTMLAGALGDYIRRYAVLPAKNIIFAVNNDAPYYDAILAQKNGANVTICDARNISNHKLAELAHQTGIRIFDQTVAIETKGKKHVQGVYLASISDDGKKLSSKAFYQKADMIAVSAGYTPSVHLHAQARGTLAFDATIGAFVPDKSAPGQSHTSIGSANGIFDLNKIVAHAQKTTLTILENLGVSADKPQSLTITGNEELMAPRPIYEMPHPKKHQVKAFVDFQNDSTANDIRLAMREGMESVEHVKRYTTTGMATDQGKTSNINAMAIIASNQKKTIPDIGYTTYRQPYIPVSMGAIAGARRDALFLPERHTPMHQAHVALGATFEPVGDWMRAWYYPATAGESLNDAVARECLAVRQSVGMFDASTLGKIDLQGKDVVWLLNMLYSNAWTQLQVGHCRYGVMLNEHGMITDDGVTTRLGEQHFHMTTTTGGAARIMDWIELWLQTEWPDKQVYATSVTEQSAVVTIAGPKARDVLAKLTDLHIDNVRFPFMSYQSGKVAGIDAKIYRITFSGELSFEINVPARYGMALWQAVEQAGQEFDILPYGTETMHVLRAEKGFIIVGQDTDGSCTPFDMNLGWIVSKKKDDFIGKRSLSRFDMTRKTRKQLVGLLCDNPKITIPEGSQITTRKTAQPPYKMIGHVSSSYHSPILGRGIALALVEGGLERMGEQIYLPQSNGKIITATISDSVFYDKEGNNARS